MLKKLLLKEKGEGRFITYERIVLALSLLFILMSLGFIYFFLFPEIMKQSFVPLHYNVHSGVDRYGEWWRIFTIPAFGLAFLIVNLLVAHYGVKKNPLLHSFLYSITLFTELILFVASLFVVFYNYSLYG